MKIRWDLSRYREQEWDHVIEYFNQLEKSMELQETPPPKASTEITYNVIDGVTGKPLNSEPLTEEAARKLASQLRESEPAASLVIRSNRVFLME